jgi:hypothetical protein
VSDHEPSSYRAIDARRHPNSVDALCAIPSTYPSSHNTILTGSSDGLLRVIELLPTRLVGVIADHGDFPIERIAIDRAGEGRWVGSVGHDEALRMTDLREVFEDEDAHAAKTEDEDNASSDEEKAGEDLKPRKRRKFDKAERELEGRPQKKGKNQIDADPSFFSGL